MLNSFLSKDLLLCYFHPVFFWSWYFETLFNITIICWSDTCGWRGHIWNRIICKILSLCLITFLFVWKMQLIAVYLCLLKIVQIWHFSFSNIFLNSSFFFFVMSHFLLISLNFITLSIFNNISLLFFFTCSCVDFWVFRFVFCLSLLHSLIRDIILLFTVFYIIFVIPLSLTYIIDFYITWNLVMFSPWPY